jgi:hypothetical protein
MYVYEFSIIKQKKPYVVIEYPTCDFSTHTVVFEEQPTKDDFAYYASQLVFAERLVTSVNTKISRVVALKVREEAGFDRDTVSHIMVMRDAYDVESINPVVGFRPNPGNDKFCGIYIVQNSRIGWKKMKLINECYHGSDIAFSSVRPGDGDRTNLRMEGDFARHCWPIYKSLLEELPGVNTRFECDRFGKLKEHKELMPERKISHATNLVKLRRHNNHRAYESTWIKQLLAWMTEQCCLGLIAYDRVMDHFSHRWGDGYIPDFGQVWWHFHNASSAWLDLSKAIGYTVPGNYLYRDHGGDSLPKLPYYINDGSVKISKQQAEVEGCVQAFYDAHQELMRMYPATYAPRPAEAEARPALPFHLSVTKPIALRYYDQYWQFIEIIFRLTDAANVLHHIVMTSNPMRPRNRPTVKADRQFFPGSYHPSSKPNNVEVVGFEEMYPMDKDPFVTTPPKMPLVTVSMPSQIPPRSTFVWNNTIEEDEEDIGAQLEQSIKTALKKLKAIARFLKALWP